MNLEYITSPPKNTRKAWDIQNIVINNVIYLGLKTE